MDLDTYVMTAYQDYLEDDPDGGYDDAQFDERKQDAESRFRRGEGMRLSEYK
eukprot:gene29886-1132_t